MVLGKIRYGLWQDMNGRSESSKGVEAGCALLLGSCLCNNEEWIREMLKGKDCDECGSSAVRCTT